MKIYLVKYYAIDGSGDCCEGIDGAFSTREFAEAYIARVQRPRGPRGCGWVTYEVDEMELDEEVEQEENQSP